MAHIVIKVKEGCGTYLASWAGHRASCTSGAKQAVEALARKLYPPMTEFVVEQLFDGSWVLQIPEAS